jgi:hypothetical protein
MDQLAFSAIAYRTLRALRERAISARKAGELKSRT